MVSQLPTGTVTFLFSDIEGSTRLIQRLGPDYRDVLDDHNRIIRDAVPSAEAFEVRTMGDSFFFTFPYAGDAVHSAVRIQRRLEEHASPEGAPLRIRIGLHTGEGRLGGDDYVGVDVNRAARIMDAGHGGQVLMSDTTRAVADTPDLEFQDLGTHLLKDLDRPQQLFQVMVPGLPAEFPPLRTRNARSNNLPATSTSLIGRDEDVAQIGDALGEHRLVTLLGPGGVGKTRLAIASAAALVGRFADGITFADLAPLTDPNTVSATPAVALELEESSLDAVLRDLEQQSKLHVLDNFENVLPAAATVETLLERASRLRLLATSQAPLALAQEHRYPVATLGSDVDSPGVGLFVTRARAVDPTFDHDPSLVSQIVAELDGLPLAIELAAARANVVPLEEMLKRLHATGFLASRAPSGPERHRSLQAALEWSYDLLDDAARTTLRRLAVFPGSMTLAAAEAVSTSDAVEDPLDAITELVERSVLYRDTDGSGRFSMPEAVLRFAGHRLAESDDREPAVSAFVDFYCAMAAEAEPQLQGDRGEWWRDRLAADHDNIRSTLEHLLERSEAVRGLELVGNIWRFFHSRGHLKELDSWLERLFAAVDSETVDRGVVKGLMALGAPRYWQSRPDEAIEHYRAAVDMARRLDDEYLRAEAAYGLGTSLIVGHLEDEALEFLDEARRLYELLDNPGGLADVLVAGIFYRIKKTGIVGLEGEFTRVGQLYADAGRMTQTTQNSYTRAWVALAERRLDDARVLALEGLDLAEQLVDSYLIAWGLECLAMAEVELGEVDRAGLLLGASRAAIEAQGGGWSPAVAGLEDGTVRLVRVLGESGAEAAIDRGRSLSLQEGLAIARGI